MPSIYITSKKRADSRVLLAIGILLLILVLVGVYFLVTSLATNKKIDNTKPNNPTSLSSTPESQPINSSPSEPQKTMEEMLGAPSTQSNTPDTQSPPMPNLISEGDKSQTIENTMPKADPTDKPTLTMDELINQTKP